MRMREHHMDFLVARRVGELAPLPRARREAAHRRECATFDSSAKHGANEVHLAAWVHLAFKHRRNERAKRLRNERAKRLRVEHRTRSQDDSAA